jgi:hypothetical protein
VLTVQARNYIVQNIKRNTAAVAGRLEQTVSLLDLALLAREVT